MKERRRKRSHFFMRSLGILILVGRAGDIATCTFYTGIDRG